jgi:HK97 family phage portal protein
VPGPDGWPDAYDYTLDGRVTRIAGEAAPGIPRVLHLKLWHPLDDHYGFSPIEAAAAAIDLHNTASSWNKALLDNSARPSGALVYAARDGSALTSDQYERLKRELESGFQGATNAGRPLLLEGGLDWKAMSLSPKDLDFQEARNAAAREIALAIGVPPQLLGIPGDATYSNYQEANRALWRHTVIPLIHRITAALTTWLGASSQLTIRPDLDAVEALAPDRDALWKRLDRTTFLTTNEKRALAGYGPLASDADILKFSPDQPRHPSGSGRQSGRWTRNPSGGGGGTSSGGSTEATDPEDGGGVGSPEFIDDFEANPEPWETSVTPEPSDDPLDADANPTRSDIEDGPRSANVRTTGGRPVDLLEEEAGGGHTIQRHVGKSIDYLSYRMTNEVYRFGFVTVGLEAAGSFPSLEAGEKLVNATIARNADKILEVTSGRAASAKLDATFDTPTGYELYRVSDRAAPRLRDTFDVRVIIYPAPTRPLGYRVQTAFPLNLK